MGWGSGVNHEGRTIGYTHESVCEAEGCEAQIDLGLAYCCGDLEGVDGERGCGHYFCYDHLCFSAAYEGQRCDECGDKETEGWSDKEFVIFIVQALGVPEGGWEYRGDDLTAVGPYRPLTDDELRDGVVINLPSKFDLSTVHVTFTIDTGESNE